jgi:tetratricopeptide (TPR) repeat protein
LDEAIEHYGLALQIEPDFVDAIINLCTVLGLKGRYDQTLELLQRALRVEPDSPLVRYSMGIAMVKNGKPQQAADYFRTALDLAVQTGQSDLAGLARRQLDALNQTP